MFAIISFAKPQWTSTTKSFFIRLYIYMQQIMVRCHIFNKIINSHASKQLNCAYNLFLFLSLYYSLIEAYGMCTVRVYSLLLWKLYIFVHMCKSFQAIYRTENKKEYHKWWRKRIALNTHRCENFFPFIQFSSVQKLRKNLILIDELFLFHIAFWAGVWKRRCFQQIAPIYELLSQENEFKEFNKPFLMFSSLFNSLGVILDFF